MCVSTTHSAWKLDVMQGAAASASTRATSSRGSDVYQGRS